MRYFHTTPTLGTILSIVLYVRSLRQYFFCYKTYFKHKIHKTITSNNQPNIFYKQKKQTNNQPNISYRQKKAFNQDIFKQLSKHLIHLGQKLLVTS